MPRRGNGGPWVIQSLGSQESLFGDDRVQVAMLSDGRFMKIDDLRDANIAPEPATSYDMKIRKLAEAAMSVCNGDCGESDVEWHHEIIALEGKFRKILGGRR